MMYDHGFFNASPHPSTASFTAEVATDAETTHLP